MKKIISYLLLLVSFQLVAADVWVSDEIEAPLRSEPSLNSDVVSLLKAGQKVEVLSKNDDDSYTQIKTADGVTGWLSNYYVLTSESVHEQLAPVQAELAKIKTELATLSNENQTLTSQLSALEERNSSLSSSLTEKDNALAANQNSSQEVVADNQVLQEKLQEQTEKIQQLTTALEQANKKANDANVKYLSLVKVSENVVGIDKQNQMLQESSVQLEQQVQLLKNENQTLKSKLNTKQTLFIAGLIFGGLIVGYILAMSTPPRKRRNYPSKF